MPAKAFVETRKSAPSRSVKSGPVRGKLESTTRPHSQLVMAPTVVVNPADDEARRQRIAEAAYRRAESRGFAPGAELEDWLQAEAEVDASSGGANQVVG